MAEPRNKIDKYGIGAQILSLRKELTCEEVADVVNAEFLPAGAEPLNKMTISRYCIAHGMTDMDRHDISKAVTYFDPLKEAVKVRDRVLKRINKLEKVMDMMKEDEEKLSELASINNAVVQQYKLLQQLNESISKIQKEQMSFENLRKAVSILLELLRKYPKVWAEYMQKLREHDIYEMMRNL